MSDRHHGWFNWSLVAAVLILVPADARLSHAQSAGRQNVTSIEDTDASDASQSQLDDPDSQGLDAASPAKADEVFKLLLKSLETLPFAALHTERSPLSAMTDWLAADEAPGGFTIDQDTELRATGEGKATVRYVRHTIEADDVRRHIAAGKQCTRLAMTWADRVSFVLTESLAIKRVAPLDVLKEKEDAVAQNEDERFDTDFALMTGELAKMIGDIVESLGGMEQKKAA